MIIIKNRWQTHLKIIVIFIVLSFIAVNFWDKSLALFVHNHHLDNYLFLRKVSEFLPIMVSSLVVITLIYQFLYIGKSFLKTIFAELYFYTTLHFSMLIKDWCKIIFGRYWPKTWLKSNLSLINDGVYGFNWFHGFFNQGSFR